MSLRREAGLVFLALLGLLAAVNCGFDTSEGTYHHGIALRIVRGEGISLPARIDGSNTAAPDGRFYPDHEIGNTLLLLPVAAVEEASRPALEARLGVERARRLQDLLRSFVPAVYVGATGAALFVLLRSGFGVPLPRALTGVLLTVFTTYLVSYARNLFDGVLAGFFVTAASAALVIHFRSGRRAPIVAASLLLGLGLVTRSTVALAVLGAAVALATDRARPFRARAGTLALLGAGLAPFVSFSLFYAALRTGSPFRSPVQTAFFGQDNHLFTGPFLPHLAGLLASPGKGVFLYVPAALLSVLAFPAFRKRWPREATFVAVVALAWLVVHASLGSNWYGHAGWGPRHFVTITPLLCVPYLVAGGVRRPVALALLSLGGLLSVAALVGNWHYRYCLREARPHDFVWSPWNGQAPDMLRSSAANLVRAVLGTPPPEILEGASEANRHASTTVNVWPVALRHAGVPLLPIVLVEGGFLAVAALALRRLGKPGPIP